MSTHKIIDRICCVVIALTLLLTIVFMNGEKLGIQKSSSVPKYESRLFDISYVHTIDIEMDDWDSFIENAESEAYNPCTVVLDGEKVSNVAIRAKGNTSLQNVASYGNNRYSFKIEFDHYDSTKTYYGLDKLCLNNIIQDNTYMKDYIIYRMMNEMGVASSLCSFIYVTVGGEDFGLYLAVEAVEDSFLQRTYGKNADGELYKPDSMSMGGGRGNGKDFNFEDIQEKLSQFQKLDSTEQSTDNTQQATEQSTKAENEAVSEKSTDTIGQTADAQTQASQSVPQMPNGEAPQMPNGEMPDMSNMPNGEMPDMSNMPDMENMPDMDNMPDFSSMFGGSQGDTDSADSTEGDTNAEKTDSTNQTEGSDKTESSTETEKSSNKVNNKNSGGFGGSMGSDDVKLIYTDDEFDSYSNIFNNAKTDITSSDKERLIASLKQLNEQTDLSEVVDIEGVINYFAVHNFSLNFDSYTGSMIHNYYLYENDGVLSMIPWDYNLAFGGFQSMGGAEGLVNYPIDSPVSSGDTESRPMLSWIFSNEEYPQMYHQALTNFLSVWFENGKFAEEIDYVKEMISPYVEKDPTKFCTYDEFIKGIDTLKQFCLLRADSIEAQLNGIIGSTDEAQEENSENLIKADGITISDMGSMGNMGRGNSTSFSKSKNEAQESSVSTTPPEKPSSENSSATQNEAATDNASSGQGDSNSSTPPEKPSGENEGGNGQGNEGSMQPPDNQGNFGGQNPPDNGGTQGETQGTDSSTSPEKPSGENSTDTQNEAATDNASSGQGDSNSSTPPEKPSGENSTDTQNETATDNASSGQGDTEKQTKENGNMKMPDNFKGQSGGINKNELIVLAICLGVLIIGIAFAALFKRRKKQ